MQFVLPILYALLFIFIIIRIKFFAVPEIPRGMMVSVFVIKIVAGIFLWIIYTYYYDSGDLQTYYNDGNTLYKLLLSDPKQFYNVVFKGASYPRLAIWNSSFEPVLYNDARTMALLNMFFRFFSFGCIHVHTVFMCFLSFMGITAIYKTFRNYFISFRGLLFLAVALVPTVLFWSSGVLKEGLLFVGIGMLLYSTNCGLSTSYSFKKIIFILFSICLLLLIKFYILIAILPGFLLNIIVSRTSEKRILLKYFSVILFSATCLIVISFADARYNIVNIIIDKQTKAISEAQGGVFLTNEKHFVSIDYDKQNQFLQEIKTDSVRIKAGSSYLQWGLENMHDTTFVTSSTDTSAFLRLYSVAPARSLVDIKRNKPDLFNILLSVPKAFFNTLLFPLPGFSLNPLKLIPALQNVIILLLLLCAVFFRKTTIRHKAIIIFCLSFVIILYTLIGLTTPVAGAIIRYKSPAIPFLIIGLFLIIDKEKLLKLFSFLKSC